MAANKEKIAFDELKKRMKGCMENEMYEDDNLFYRFLKARDFKIDKAEYMLRQHIEWRKKYDVKNIVKWKPPGALERYMIVTNLGYNREGCLVKYHHFSHTDFRGIIEAYKSEDWYKCLIYYFEKDFQEMKHQSKKFGKTVDKVIYIEDMENFSLAKATDKKIMSNVISTLFLYMNNYPETLKTVYVINAPSYFSLFYSMLKPFLPSTVIQKAKVYSDDSWKKDLLRIIDAEVLPAFLGGTRTDPDGNPLCHTVVKNPEIVPKRYYLCNKQMFASFPGIEQITVPRAEVHEMCFSVTEPGCYLEWEFQLKSGDIDFGILYKDHEGKETEVVPMKGITTVEYIERGIIKCEDSGIYVVIFDNSDSQLETRIIYYKITIKSPHEVSLGPTYVLNEGLIN